MVYQEVGRARLRLYEEIVNQIQDLIINEDLRLGDKLPPESELIGKFGVSKSVVREAIRALEERGLVTVKHGRGVYVSQPSSASVSESLSRLLRASKGSLLALHEVREMLEIGIAGLAAERATEAEIELMEDALQREAQIIDSPDDLVELDLQFHELLARATHNDVVPILLNPLTDLLRDSRHAIMESKETAVGPVLSGTIRLLDHRQILAAVESRHTGQAREAMDRHLQKVRAFLIALDSAPACPEAQ